MKTLMKTNQPRSLNRNQNGFASIVIALTLIVIMALITVGFAQLSRREQQQALNKQLAVQANYAAESGINDAISDIQTSKLLDGNLQESKPTCDPPSSASNKDSKGNTIDVNGDLNYNVIDTQHAVSYTCALVNQEPPDLVYGDVPTATGHSVRVTSADDVSQFATITVQWYTSDDGTLFPNNPGFLSSAAWKSAKYAPMLEFSMTELSGYDRSTLINNTFTDYLFPFNSSGGHAVSVVDTTDPLTLPDEPVGYCSNAASRKPYVCSVKFKVPKNTDYLFHFLDFYDPANVRITGTYANGSTAYFAGGQAIIDITGKAQDVYKRLQARVPLDDPTGTLPDDSLQVSDVCKRLAASGSATSPTTTDTTGITLPAGSDACNPFN